MISGLSPHEHLISVLKDMGHESDAKDIGVDKEEKLRERSVDGSFFKKYLGRPWGWLIWCLIGHGYQPYHVLVPMLAMIIVSGIGFWVADTEGSMRPSKERILTHECYLLNIETVSCTESGWKEILSSIDNRVLYRIPPDYPKFQNIMYSIDVFIPFFDLHQESFWIPTTPGFKILMWLHTLVGWFLTTIGVVGLSGIVKQD